MPLSTTQAKTTANRFGEGKAGPKAAAAVALCATAILFFWQLLEVRYLHQNNWTSLFYAGDKARVPPQLAHENIYLFPNVVGYDGHLYHIIAHDPWLRTDMSTYLDQPRLRYRRILVPALASVLALGQDRLVHTTYFAIIFASTFLGTFWLSRLSDSWGRSVWWGAVFAITPAALLSANMMVVDVTLSALTVGAFWYAARNSPRALWVVLACAPLVRETGVLVTGGWLLWYLYRRQIRETAVYATALLPFVCWWAFLSMHTPARGISWLSAVPFAGFVGTLSHPFAYSSNAKLLLTLDRLGLLGMAVAFAFVFRDLVRRAEWTFITFVSMTYFVLAAALSQGDVWPEVGAFGRAFTPFLLAVMIPGILSGKLYRLLPLAFILPRLLIIYGYHLGNVVKAVRSAGL